MNDNDIPSSKWSDIALPAGIALILLSFFLGAGGCIYLEKTGGHPIIVINTK